MSFAKSIAILLFPLLLLASCGDNLAPSGEDKRDEVQTGTTGAAVGQNAPGFSVSDINSNTVTLSSALASSKGVVLYFTMWCSVCDSHMSNMRDNAMATYTNVRFYAIDYVSGSVSDARSSAISNGYYNSGFTILADTENAITKNYSATMGTTVVIDASGVIRMNEDYKDGSRLLSTLSALQ